MLLFRYVHGTSEDTPYIWYEGSGLTDPRSLQADHQGSIVSVANASGAALAIDSYDEYGVPGAGNVGRFQYTGQAWIPELGMYYYKARMYAPRLGRFLQTDPIGYADQNNLYAYVANDPVNHDDSSGECTGSLISSKDGQCAGGGFVAGPGFSVGGSITQVANAAHGGQNQGNVGSRGYLNLLDDEGRGTPPGHSVSEHVGKTDQQLLRDIGARDIGQVSIMKAESSSFRSLISANKLVSSTLATGRQLSPGVYYRNFGSFTGRIALREGVSFFSEGRAVLRDTTAVIVVTRPDPTMPGGIRVLTAYPTLAR